MRKSAILLLAAGMAACSAAGNHITGTTDEPLPENYRDIVTQHMRLAFFDPTSVRDAEISQPINGGSPLYPGWTVCVRANAKNRFGAYAGRQATAVVIQGGQVVQTNTEDAWTFCLGANYTPYPELMG